MIYYYINTQVVHLAKNKIGKFYLLMTYFLVLPLKRAIKFTL
jgi:hypothetical protein